MTRLGKDGYFTNTSLRRTAKSRLVEAGIPREVAKRRTGHLSEADVVYVGGEVIEKQISNVLYGKSVSESSQEYSDITRRKDVASLVFKDCVFQNCTFNTCIIFDISNIYKDLCRPFFVASLHC